MLPKFKFKFYIFFIYYFVMIFYQDFCGALFLAITVLPKALVVKNGM